MHTESHRQWGGQEMRVFNESRWMIRNGHQIVIIAPKESRIFEHAKNEGWETHDIPFNKFGMLKDFFRLRSLLRKIRPDVLNTHGNTDAKVALTAARGLGIPCIIRSRHSTPPVRNSWYNRLLYRKWCDYVFTSANFVKDQLVKDLDVSENNAFSLPSPFFPPSDLPGHEEARLKLAEELNLDSGSRFIGYVGRLSPEKGLTFLLEAFARIKERLSNYHLVLVGKGDFLSVLEEQVVKENMQGRVHFSGFKDDPWPYYKAFDCKVLASSKYEAAAQVIQQAMYAHCPVVGTEAGGIPDLIGHEKTGLLVPPDNSEKLADALLMTIENPDATALRAEKAFEYVKANHTYDVLGNRILDIYNDSVWPKI